MLAHTQLSYVVPCGGIYLLDLQYKGLLTSFKGIKEIKSRCFILTKKSGKKYLTRRTDIECDHLLVFLLLSKPNKFLPFLQVSPNRCSPFL
jgi:hypothetical protein